MKKNESTQSLVSGTVMRAFGNLLQVKFEGQIRQGEIAMIDVDGTKLKAEVLEIVGNEAKVQVFEDTRGVQFGMQASFQEELLEAELGPGLLQSVVDGLQNPLQGIAKEAGLFLERGFYLKALDRKVKWDYKPLAKVNDKLVRGDNLGVTKEGRFDHFIMVPFSCFGVYTITEVVPAGSYTVDQVVAKAKDEEGKIFEFTMVQRWPIKAPLLEGERISPSKMMDTGLRVIDTQFPVMKGGTFCTPGPFGAGKTVLQHHLSKYSSVDIVIVAACGERAGEVVEVLQTFPELIDPHTGDPLITRTVIICNTSSMPVAARESSVYLGITMAEYYRQMGLDVLLLADSTSRWAQALREMSGRLEEIPGEEAFPAYLASRIASFYERAGVVALKEDKVGSVTLCGAVSPAGGNFEEPVTQATLSVVGAFLGLSKARSDSRRYPAIDPLISWSKYITGTGEILSEEVEGWSEMVKRGIKFLKEGNEIGKRMEVVGEEGTALNDMIVYLKGELYDFVYLQQNAFDKEDAYCPLKRQIPLFRLINRIFQTPFAFASHDAARQFFLTLQNQLKNLNYAAFETEEYKSQVGKIEEMIESAHKVG